MQAELCNSDAHRRVRCGAVPPASAPCTVAASSARMSFSRRLTVAGSSLSGSGCLSRDAAGVLPRCASKPSEGLQSDATFALPVRGVEDCGCGHGNVASLTALVGMLLRLALCC